MFDCKIEEKIKIRKLTDTINHQVDQNILLREELFNSNNHVSRLEREVKELHQEILNKNELIKSLEDQLSLTCEKLE